MRRPGDLPAVRTETITLGLGCFWGPDAWFGHRAGVIRTRVGYAGGTVPEPTYREMGDHSETVEVEFDPERVGLEMLLEAFWDRHNPDNINGYKGRQYHSLLLYRDEGQLEAARRVEAFRKERGVWQEGTEVVPFTVFTPAEERHQKYYLKRFPAAVDKLLELCPDEEALTGSTLAARLNGLAKGYLNRSALLEELRGWPVPEEERERLIGLVGGMKW